MIRILLLRSAPTGLRYLVVGGAAFVIEMAALFLLKRLGASDILAVSISFWVGFFVAFVMQKIVTFENKAKNTRGVLRQIMLYSLLVSVNYLFTLLMVEVLSSVLAVYVIRSGVIAVTTVWNFFIYKFIFRR